MSSTKIQISDLVAKIKREVSFREMFRELYADQFRAHGNSHCPFHNDSDPSFQVEKDHGYCHAGCTPENGSKNFDVIFLYMIAKKVDFKIAIHELAAKYGIQSAQKPMKKGKIVETYPYHDESGDVLYEVCRLEPKGDFPLRRPDGKGGTIWNMNGVRRVLLGLPDLLAIDPKQPILFVEGEKDALRARSAGFASTTAPGGADKKGSKWPGLVEKYAIHKPLKGREVWIIPDNDAPGHAHALAVANTLHGFAASVKILTLPDLPEKGDVSDFIDQHGPEEGKRLLLEIAEKTLEYNPPKPVRFGSLSCADLMAAEIPDIKWIIFGLLCEGLIILAGSPKIGKSWLVLSLCLAIVSGRKALSHFPSQSGTVLYLALEDNPRRLKRRLITMGISEDTPGLDKLFIETQSPTLHEPKDRPNLIDVLEKWLEEHPDAALIAIDTLAKIRNQSKASKSVYEQDYHDIEVLQQIASRYSVAILVVTHDRKELDEDPFKTISGSTGVIGAADAGWVLTKKRGETEGNIFISGRDVEERKGAVEFDKETGWWRWIGDAAELKMNRLSLEIRNVIMDTGKPAAPKEISKALSPHYRYETVKKTLSRMVVKGELIKAPNHKYSLPPEDLYYGKAGSCPEKEPVQDEIYLDSI